MASQALRQRPKEGPSVSSTTTTTNNNNDDGHHRRAKKLALARKGLRSLALAVVVPLVFSALAAYVSGCSATFASKPTWHPPLWAFHLASVSAASLMGLSAWLVWAEGAFHREPAVLGLYLGQFLVGLSWGPLVFRAGALRAGLAASVAAFGSMFMCTQCFRKVNPLAGDLVKPCLAWVLFLIVFNYKLLV